MNDFLVPLPPMPSITATVTSISPLGFEKGGTEREDPGSTGVCPEAQNGATPVWTDVCERAVVPKAEAERGLQVSRLGDLGPLT